MKILDYLGLPRWHPIWDGNPRLARPEEGGDLQTIVNSGNARPYIVGKTSERWTWREYDCEPGEIYFTPAERAFASGFRPHVVVEPTIKLKASPNKQWPYPHWRRLIRLLSAAGHPVTQLGPLGTRQTPEVARIVTPDFRKAAAVLANARLYIGPDGGLHHAAAAMGVPAIVIRGAFISEKVTGYVHHRNFFNGEGLGCGMRTPCSCCARAMHAITPESVADAALEILRA